MTANTIHWLRQTRHTGIPAESLAAALPGQACDFGFGEDIEVCYLAAGTDAAEMERHLAAQRSNLPWRRHWICDPDKMDTVKVIVFAYRETLNEAISTYSRHGVASVEVMADDMAFPLEDISQIVVGHADQNLLYVIGFRLGLIGCSMRHLHFDETMQLLKKPASAKNACWLLNRRDQLYGRATLIKIEDLPWLVPVAEWDVVACKAIHPDGHAIIFDGEWKSLRLSDFWHRYCGHLKGTDVNILSLWKSQVRVAAARAKAPDCRDRACRAFEEADALEQNETDL